MARNIAAILFSCMIFSELPAQNFVFTPHQFGTNLFAGGIDTPRFQFLDIDGDNDNDLFLLDRDEKLWFYRNAGGSLRLEMNGAFGIVIGSWFRFVDIDGDGDDDCMTNGRFSEVSLFTNIGSKTSPSFQLTIPAMLDTSGGELFSERFSVPAFADMDDDGDYDFFTGGSIGSITYYKNIGSKASPQFTFITSEYQGINIQGGPNTFPKPQHGASAIEFFDADGNGVQDLFWGDYFNPSLYYLRNNGTKQNASIVLVDSTYPNEDIVTSFGFNFPQHVDADQDGTIDLMVGCVFPNAEYNNLMFYKNTGTNIAPYYTLQTKNFVPMIDVGSRSTVATSDFDGDGDIDLCVSSGGGSISIYQNSGTRSAPQYTALPTSVFSLGGALNLSIAAGDLNGDNIPDLAAGTYENGLKTFMNTSSNGVISFAQLNHPLNAINPGQNASPCIVDIDHDGKTDILAGNSGGQLWYLKNIGTNTSPVYSSETNFNSIDVGNDAIPCIGDFDKDGRTDLLIGNNGGNIWHYREVEGIPGTYELVNKKFQDIDVKTQAAPALGDVDADGDSDLLVGNGKGGLFFYENTASSKYQQPVPMIPASNWLRQNYPNPFNPATTITFNLPRNSYVSLKIIDVLGRAVDTLIDGALDHGEHSIVWDAVHFSSGVYFCRFVSTADEFRHEETKTMLLHK